jgi:hypothetical protein
MFNYLGCQLSSNSNYYLQNELQEFDHLCEQLNAHCSKNLKWDNPKTLQSSSSAISLIRQWLLDFNYEIPEISGRLDKNQETCICQ